MDEAAVLQLKDARAKARSSLTTVCNKLLKRKTIPLSDVKQLRQHLEAAYDKLIETHHNFADAILSDEKFADMGVVSGASLDDYIANCEGLYYDSVAHYTTIVAPLYSRQAKFAIQTAKAMLSDTFVHCDDFYTTDLANHIDCMKELCEHFDTHPSEHTATLLDELDTLIVNLECLRVQSIKKSTVQNTPSHTQNSQCDGIQPDPNSNSSQSHSQSTDQHVHERVSVQSNNEPPVGRTPPSAASTIRPAHSLDGSNHNQGTSSGGGENIEGRVDTNPNSSNTRSHPSYPCTQGDLSIRSLYDGNTNTLLDMHVVSEPVDSRVNSRFKFNKSPLPTFSGDRRAYGEFRSIWRMFASREFNSDQERAWELKQCLKGEAYDYVESINTTHAGAYALMWDRLNKIYCNISLSVKDVYSKLSSLTPVREEDIKGLVKFVNQVEICYSQLGEIGHIDSITICQVDDLVKLLPATFRWQWMERIKSSPTTEQLHPFSAFMEFLEGKRDTAVRLSGSSATSIQSSPSSGKPKKASSNAASVTEREQASSQPDNKPSSCFIHPDATHPQEDCRKFSELSIDERYNLLKEHHACYRCLKKHPRNKCKGSRCSSCKKNNHHKLLCRGSSSQDNKTDSHSVTATESVQSNHCNAGSSLLPIQRVPHYSTANILNVFFDGGSNASLVTHSAAQRIRARRVRSLKLDLTSTGNLETQIETHIYEIVLKSPSKSAITILAYGLNEITGQVGCADLAILQRLFPKLRVASLERGDTVDLLIGSDYTGLHPRREIARAGDHLCVLEGPLGRCIQGAHPDLRLNHRPSSQFASIHASVAARDLSLPSHAEFSTPVTHFSKAEESKIAQFIQGENLGTELAIKCGGCKCSKCPTPGHTYSFIEEQELQLIRQNLVYDGDQKCWVTTYPWTTDPSKLPDNYRSAFATLQSTERTLRKDPQWAEVYSGQIQDMVDRKVARLLSSDELESWQGPFFYISHLAVQNPKSTSTPVRIVFNSSQVVQGISLNSCLAKGPDAYINNLVGVLLRWRQGQVAMVADIKKMYNSIHVGLVEQHCHRFLWRDLENREPDVYVITRVNMGDRPAAAISAEAIYKTADMFESQYPEVGQLLKQSTYVDDIAHAVATKQEAESLANSTTTVLKAAGFAIKHWLFSGESEPRTEVGSGPPSSSDPNYRTQVLGIHWRPLTDKMGTEIKLNFSPKRKGVYTEPNLLAEQIPQSLPTILTRRSVLEQTMKLYDPLGLYCAFTLKAKCLLRETWTLQLGWDDPLPEHLVRQWSSYFSELFELGQWEYDRSLIPPDAVGDPVLVILSDASDVAYGFVAYIRWQLSDGQYSCRFIMAKSRIAPLRKLSTPQMELCGAVLSKRGRKVIETECGFNFERVYQLVDSETILCSINKTSTRFKLFEGVRIAEIQAATDGDLGDWYWVKGTENTADWLTRGKSPAELGPDSDWWNGPAFLYSEVNQWGIKSHAQCIEVSCSTSLMEAGDSQTRNIDVFCFDRFKSSRILIWTFARILSVFQHKSFRGGRTEAITPQICESARILLIKEAQQNIISDIHQQKGKFSKLSLFQDQNGIWCVGSRLGRSNPMTTPQSSQTLLPTKHHLTTLLMMDSHKRGNHRGRDATLARFRYQYWITQGSKVAQRIINSCQLCRVRNVNLLSQGMGSLPEERLKPGPPFNHTMVDLFGPYLVRGEVQKRTSGKVYGILFTDLASRAIHIEPAFAYDTDSFLMALQRFTNLRGWPEIIISDPGTQLIGASRELITMWEGLQKEAVYKLSTDNGTTWKFSPADSPWRQGAVESLVKAAKRAIKLAINDTRLSPTEFLTLCSEITNILNERPLGTLPSSDSDINILTPNVQLIGRSFSRNPGGWNYISSPQARIQLVNSISQEFWNKWTELYAPAMVTQNKWYRKQDNLKVGDVVAIADSNSLRGKYHLAQVQEVFPGKDGCVRKVALRYKNFRVGEKLHEYKGSGDVVVYRSVQKLALLVPVDDSSK